MSSTKSFDSKSLKKTTRKLPLFMRTQVSQNINDFVVTGYKPTTESKPTKSKHTKSNTTTIVKKIVNK